MKTKLKKEIHTKTGAELEQAISEARKALFDLRMEKMRHTLKNGRSIFMKRKELAILQTVSRNQQSAEALTKGDK